MSTVTLSPIVAELEATDISTLDEQAVRAAMQHVARLSNWTAAVRSALVRRLDELADLARLQAELRSDPAAAPATAVALSSLEATLAEFLP